MKKFLLLIAAVYVSIVAGCGTTSIDTTAPTISSVNPTGGATGVAASSVIAVKFSEAMNQEATQATFSISPIVTGNFAWSGNTMTFTSSAPLATDTLYTCGVGTDAKDVAGNHIETAYSWSFNSIDTIAPTVSSVSPTNAASGVTAKSTITIMFSEPMNQGSARAAFSTSPGVTGTFTWSGNAMTFTPSADLPNSTTFTVAVGTGAQDLAGNALTSEYVFSWRTGLPYTVVNLTSDLVSTPTSGDGIVPSLDGQNIYWWDGTIGEGSGCDVHLYRVSLSDLSSLTIWTNRSVFGGVYDDGVDTWVGNYYPYAAAKIPNAAPLTFVNNDSTGGHNITLYGNKLDFSYVYFGSSSSMGISYWNRNNNTTGIINGSGSNVYQSAVIGNKIYFPRGSTMNTSGIMVVDAVNNPTVLESTLLDSNAQISNANDIYTDGTYLYVPNGTTKVINKIDPSGTGSIVATFSPGVLFTNPVIIGDYIYSGASNDKHIYVMDKNTGSLVIKDCSVYLPTPVGTPRWDLYNDGIWFGPESGFTTQKTAYFIPRSKIDAL